ncbi:MAG: tandem-95 repeat protein, partial [Betaproteobacteria bacterium]|nr:tandem-95 repeat protein [Betaproteobacteria bacterium]
MTQSGAPKTLRGKAARPTSLGTSVPQPEQLALLLDPLSNPTIPSASAQAGVPAAKAPRAGKDKRVPGQAEEPTVQTDWMADADEVISAPSGLAYDASNTVLVAQAAGAGAGSTSGNSDAAGSASSSSGSSAGLFGVTQAEIASMAPALFAFGAGALVLREATASSSSATPAVNEPPVVVTSLAILNAGVKADEGLPVTFKIGAFRDPEGGRLSFKFAVTTAAGQPVDTSGWTFTLNEVDQTVVVTAPLGAKGDYKITVTATDVAGASKADTFEVTFANSDAVKTIDGYLKGALVFRDLDNDGVWDHGPINSVSVTESNGNYTVVINNGAAFSAEPWGITNARGESPTIGAGGGSGNQPLRAVAWTFGGAVNGNQSVVLETIDVSTNRSWNGGYTSPANSAIVNPLSTLAAAVGDAGKVRTALGLGPSIDPFNTDPLAVAADATSVEGARDSLRAQAASIQVANILRVAQEAAGSVGLTNAAKVAEVVGSQLVGNGLSRVDLTSAAGLKNVLEQVATLATGNAATALNAAAESVAKGLAAINTVINQAVEQAITRAGTSFESLDVGAALSSAVQYQIVAQAVLAQAAAKAVAGVALTGDTSLVGTALASLSDLISGDLAKVNSYLDSAIIQTRASVGTLFVSSARTVAATAIDDNAFALYKSDTAKGSVSGNLLSNDLVPIGFSKSLFSARVGDELAVTPTYKAITGTSSSSFTGAYGTLELWADGRYVYTVTTTLTQPDTVVEDAFSYRLSADGTATLADTARYDFGSLVIKVSNRNDPPVVQLLQGEVFEQGIGVDPLARDKAAFNLLRAGTDPEGATLQLGSVSFKPQVGAVRSLGAESGAEILGEFGTLKRVGLTGEFVYTLNQALADFLTANDTRTEVFTFLLSDGVKSTSSSVVVTIRGADDAAPTENRPPVGFDKTIIIQEDAAYTFKPAEDFQFRDPNPQDTLAKVRIVQRPSSTAGTLTLDGQAVQDNQLIDAAALNKLVFTPAANLNGSEVAKFTFRVVDAGGLESAPAKTIAFDIKAVNDAPVGTADTLAATEDTPITYTAAQLVGNDTDVDGDTLSIKSVTAVTGGTVLLNTNGSVQFAPTANFNGPASFSYVATDGKLDTAATSVAVSVSAVNDAPVNTVPSAQTVNEDTNLSLTGLSIADIDAGSASVTLTLGVKQGTITVAAANGVTLGTNGTSNVTLSGTVAAINGALAAAGGVVYRGALNYNGADTLTMTTSDAGNTGSGGALLDIDTVAITVAAVNDRPVFATNLVSKFSVKEFAVGSIPPAGQPPPHGVLFTASASDPDGSTSGGLTYSIVLSPPANISTELSSPSLYEDGALFRINALTGAIEFIRDPITPGNFSREFSFELDLDKNGDGIFRLVIEVSDGTLREYLPIEITLQNVDEDGTLEIFRVNQGLGETKLAANAIVRQGDVLQARLVEPDEFSITALGPIDYGETFEWFADGVKILRPPADVGKPTLTVTDSLIGRQISVRVSYSEAPVFGSGTDLQNNLSSVTLGAVLPANAAPTLIPTTGSLGSVTVTAGSATTPFDVKPFFADDGGVAQLTFTIRDSTGAALPDGLAIGAGGFLEGTPQAGWISAQPRTLFVTATDQGGASVTGTLTVRGQVANDMSGIYVTSAQVGMVDFSGTAPTESRSSTIGQFGADASAPGKARLTAVISGVSDGAPVGADLDRGNLLNLLDANPATGGVSYITIPVISTLAANSTVSGGKLALKLVLQGVLDVNTEVNVSLVTDSAGVARIVVVGDQTALAGLVSFKNGDELGRTISSDGRTLMRIDLLALLDKGITASGKSILAGVVTDDLEASFSVGFVGLPMYTPTGVALSGVDASIVIDDTPNRAPSIVMPHGPADGTKKLAVSLPAGTAVGVGALLADLDATGGLFPDSINDVNGDQLSVLLSQPASGQLIYRGDVVIFPSASAAGQSDFVWGGNRAWLRVPILDIGSVEYRSGNSANVPAGTLAELASMQVVVADSFRAMSAPAAVEISIAAKPVETVLAAADGNLSPISVPGVTTIGSLGISGSATVMAVPSTSIGKLFKGTVNGTTLSNPVEVKVGDTISGSDLFGFTPAAATSASGAFRDDLLLQQAGVNGVSYLRIDFGLAAVGTDTLGAVTVTSSANVVNVLDAGQIIENAQI